ncbi:hypothetical protein DPSP01_014782 [Paraphaeosphaeria sporulosa]
MIGLFQNNGPCYFIINTTLVQNSSSSNTNAGMLYIDQPASGHRLLLWVRQGGDGGQLDEAGGAVRVCAPVGAAATRAIPVAGREEARCRERELWRALGSDS